MRNLDDRMFRSKNLFIAKTCFVAHACTHMYKNDIITRVSEATKPLSV